METLAQDLRFALRSLRKNRGFSAVAILTLALGIGSATAIFSVADGVPGVREAGASPLLPLASTMGDAGIRVLGSERADNESMQAEWQFATPGYLEVMNILLLAGRTFDERDVEGGQEVIIINEALARRYWGESESGGDGGFPVPGGVPGGGSGGERGS